MLTIRSNSRRSGVVYDYHDRTKHHVQRYARSLEYMDWENQPDPFRRYEGAATIALDHPGITEAPTYDALFESWARPVAPLDRDSISRLFFESLAISAWKQVGDSRWSLRVNPSSGDLHPTEAYLITGSVGGLSEAAAVYHYSAYEHALERRTVLTDEEWADTGRNLPPGTLLVALCTIYWRESWKYGERAFRYCHHDVGHAIGTLTFAAALLGWKTRLIHSLSDDVLAAVLGLNRQKSVEAERPDCLLAIIPADQDTSPGDPIVDLPPALLERLRVGDFEGRPNTLSRHHHEWPSIDTVADACRFDGAFPLGDQPDPDQETKRDSCFAKDRGIPARRIIRERRSAVAMDGRSTIDKETFYRMMAHVCPDGGRNILGVLPWRARVSLALFVHRVDGLSAGLYALVREPGHEGSLRQALHTDFHWRKPGDCPGTLGLYLLQDADARDAARLISCHQDIAADGVFALGMLAEFDASLERYGAAFYPRLFWETGLIGQILYLEAEAAGIRATGIGCFFDDAMHEALGIRGHGWQSLYHFTVGGPVDDPRLQTLPSYSHLSSR